MTRTPVPRVLSGLCLAFAMVLMAGCGTELQPTQPRTGQLTGTLAGLGRADGRPTATRSSGRAAEVLLPDSFASGGSAPRTGTGSSSPVTRIRCDFFFLAAGDCKKNNGH